MSKLAGDPLVKVTFNMYASDKQAFETVYGPDFSVRMREVLREHVKGLKPRKKMTLEDYINGECDA